MRKAFHMALLESGLLSIAARKTQKRGSPVEVPTNADCGNAVSIALARAIYDRIQSEGTVSAGHGPRIVGSKFEQITQSYIQQTFSRLNSLQPGLFHNVSEMSVVLSLAQRDAAGLADSAKSNAKLAVLLGSANVIVPDVLVFREPESDHYVNANRQAIDKTAALRSILGTRNNTPRILHASISCKWILRRDQSEVLNLMGNRDGGRNSHIVVVTGEPMPSRLASLALGAGDINCVYHFALPELMSAVKRLCPEDSVRLVKIMIEGKRLRDIGDLPLDLVA